MTSEHNRTKESHFLRSTAAGSMAGLAIGVCMINHQSIGRIVNTYNGLSNTEKIVTESVSFITNTDTTVLCDGDLPDHIYDNKRYRIQGYVAPVRLGKWSYTPDIITLRPEICNSIANAVATQDLTPDAAESLLTAAHEVTHTQLPGASEAEVECRAVLRLPSQLMQTGLSSDEAVLITKDAAKASYASMPDEYKDDANCRPGGRYAVSVELEGITPLVYNNRASLS